MPIFEISKEHNYNVKLVKEKKNNHKVKYIKRVKFIV